MLYSSSIIIEVHLQLQLSNTKGIYCLLIQKEQVNEVTHYFNNSQVVSFVFRAIEKHIDIEF